MTAYLASMREVFMSPASVFIPMAPIERTERHGSLKSDVARIAADFRKLLPIAESNPLEGDTEALLPSTLTLRELNDIVNNGAERYFQMVEAEQAHRLRRDEANLRRAWRGQWMGCGILCLALAGAVFIGWTNAPWQIGVALVSLPVAAIILSLQARR